MRRERIELFKIKQDKTFEKGFEEFILYCKAKNLREATVKHYYTIVHIIYKFIPPSTKINLITSKTVEQLILYLRVETNQNSVSINTTLVTLRAILYYFMKLDYMKSFKVSLIKAEKKIKETYTEAELHLLLQKPNIKNCTFLEYRNWVCVNFFMATGCRAGTLCNLRIKDLDFDNELIRFSWTKNRRQQIVPMSNSLKLILIEYLQYREGGAEDYVFVNSYRGYLKPDQLAHNIIKYNRRRGVLKTGVHRFRHTFAKNWILNGGDIFKLQKMLGHSSMDMVRNYVEMFTDDLQQDFNMVNPLENLQKHNKKDFMRLRG